MNIDAFLNRIKTAPLMSSIVRLIPHRAKSSMRKLLDGAKQPSAIRGVLSQSSQTNDLLARMLYEQAMSLPRFQDSQRLLGHGFKVYSQHDEDGILEAIFARIGVTSRFFVEFGVGDGLDNCTTYCLLKEWSGAWIDGSAACYQGILKKMKFLIAAQRLRVRYAFITAENIEALFDDLRVPETFDLLSIDIGRNDYWIWKAIRRFRPRVVAIEYNASFKQTVACTVPYEPSAIWDGSTNYYGSSLKALEYLGNDKGYCLVGCNYTGVTAFFVRNDCMGDHFAAPYTSENHYEPPRYFARMPNGHAAGFGPVVTIQPSNRRDI